MKTITSLPEARDYVARFRDGSHKWIAALTGAGISTESGVPDFRSPGGIWTRREPIQYRDFIADQDRRLEDWDRRFEMLSIFRRASPNAAHRALTRLHRAGTLRSLATQNVDGLHQRSGYPDDNLVELHGNSTYATCLDCGARAELEDQRQSVQAGRSPVCLHCGGLLKAAVVSFGQMLPEDALMSAMEAAETCDLYVVMGSSLVVHPAAGLPELAVRSGARLVILNREETPLDSIADVVIRTPLAATFAEFGEEPPDFDQMACG